MIIGIGTDIVEIGHIKQAIIRSKNKFLYKVFTEDEIKYCEYQSNSFQHFAARFAAKEATLKALGTGWAKGISFRQIEITNNKLGAPQLLVSDKANSITSKMGVSNIFVSLSHSENFATAIVIFENTYDVTNYT